MTSQIGFVGLGIMGRGMVKNLVEKNHPVTVWNRTPERSEALRKDLAVNIAPNLQSLAESSDIILICVSDTPDVESVLFGESGLAKKLRSGTIVVDLSTISPAATRAFGQTLAEKNIALLDAPVSGGSEGAAKGTLSIMVGGPEDVFASVEPILQAIGTRITHMGPSGSGQTTKLMNQILVVVNMLAVSEALLLGRAANVDLLKAVRAVEAGAGGSWMLSQRAPQAIDGYWQPGFTIDLQQKDLRLVLESARELGLPLFATSLVHQLYNKLQKDGKGGLGNHALVQALEDLSGLRIAKEQA
ncbi:MAG TPA: NAD(P)-dependent oxidoreductase [Edaphobacter sp.]|jgi:3-hydroxyisobutyrate dehydrogenase-like beta-hydroxyacid dehydrogenase|nr:NAD(P)-dependent oxidoreductase [Edaphobacter sp.]